MMTEKLEAFTCVLCGEHIAPDLVRGQFGNNPQPLAYTGQCCDLCNADVVMARLEHDRQTETKEY